MLLSSPFYRSRFFCPPPLSSCVWSTVDKPRRGRVLCAVHPSFPSPSSSLCPFHVRAAGLLLSVSVRNSIFQSYAAIRHPEWRLQQLPPRRASPSSPPPSPRSPFQTLTRRTPACTESVWWPRRTALCHSMPSRSFSRWNRNNRPCLNSRLISTGRAGCESRRLPQKTSAEQ